MNTAAGNSAQTADLIELSSEIVAAYVSHNALTPNAVPSLIADVFTALKGLGVAPATPTAEAPTPAVAVRRSITPDHLVCLEDGKKFKTLKRHLMTHHNLTPSQYRQRWGLPGDYPMVAPIYSETRSSLAKSGGLGRRALPAKRERKVS